MDVQISAGHTIRLSLASTGEDYLPASTSSVVEVSEGTGSNLILDVIDPMRSCCSARPVARMRLVWIGSTKQHNLNFEKLILSCGT